MVSVILLIRKNIFVYFWKMVLFRWIITLRSNLSVVSVSGKKNWVMIDTIAGAESSAIIYSLAETAKANNLKPYDYFKYLFDRNPKTP